MKLAATVATMAELAAGRLPPETAAERLGAPIAAIALYARLARSARRSLVDGMFPHCRHAVVARAGEAAWHTLVEDYFNAYPELRFVRHANVAAFPTFIAKLAPHSWLADLADLEWQEWTTEIAPRTKADDAPESGALRVASTLRLRLYAHDLVSWIDGAGREGEPVARPTLVAFWQDRDAISFRNALSEAHVATLAAIVNGAPSRPDVLDELRGADLVLGAP